MLWIGGSTCSGKSSIADLLGSTHGLPVYHYDRLEREHIARMSRQEYPLYARAVEGSMDERWVHRAPEEMYELLFGSWSERFALVVEDLMSMGAAPYVVAEGAGLFPALVEPLLPTRRHGVWLVASNEAIASVRASRPTTIREQTSDPERAISNIISGTSRWPPASERRPQGSTSGYLR